MSSWLMNAAIILLDASFRFHWQLVIQMRLALILYRLITYPVDKLPNTLVTDLIRHFVIFINPKPSQYPGSLNMCLYSVKVWWYWYYLILMVMFSCRRGICLIQATLVPYNKNNETLVWEFVPILIILISFNSGEGGLAEIL